MSISQSNYVDITSAVAGASSAGAPSLAHRRVTIGGLKNAAGVELENGEILNFSFGMLQNAADFLLDVKDQNFAAQYFSVKTSAPANKPKALQFVKSVDDSENSVDYYISARAANKSYGSFSIESINELGQADLDRLKAYHAACNVEHQFIIALNPATVTKAAIEADPLYVTFKDCPMTAFVLSATPGQYKEVIPAGLIDATDFEGKNTVNQTMFRQVSGMTPDVTSDAIKEILDGLHVNFYGQTGENATEIKFFQRGTLKGGVADLRDIMAAAFEQWTKGKVAADLISALVASRIPANLDGTARIRSIIVNGAISAGLRSGGILKMKTLSPIQEGVIFDMTGDELAAVDVFSAGYWLDVQIRTAVVNGIEEKHAHYVLIYSKADFVRKIVGSHNLI